MIQEAAKYVDEIHDMPLKLELIDTLRTVTDGKVIFCGLDFLNECVDLC